jgi:hypothetical protein
MIVVRFGRICPQRHTIMAFRLGRTPKRHTILAPWPRAGGETVDYALQISGRCLWYLSG